MSRRVATYLALFVLVGLTGGCISFGGTAPPPQKELVNTDFVGQHSVRYLLQKAKKVTVATNAPSSGEDAAEQAVSVAANDSSASEDTESIQYYHLYVEICDIGANNEENNCKSSKVLDTIVRYNRTSGDDERIYRQVTDMFWNTSDTLFVSYLAPNPSVKSCRLKNDNTMQCADQPNINNILHQKKVFKTEIGKGGK